MTFPTLFLIALSASLGFAAGFQSNAIGGAIHCVACILVPVLVVLLFRPASATRQLLATFGLLVLLEAFRFIPIRFGPAWSYIGADHQAREWLIASFVAPFAVGLLAVGTARLFAARAEQRAGPVR